MNSRFRVDQVPGFGGKLFSRSDVNPRLGFEEAMDPGIFLAHLWALFGPARPVDDGFCYDLVDGRTGLRFSAYSGPSGPSYAGGLGNEARLKPVLEAFEALLEGTKPVDCEIAYAADIEYGGGRRKIGFESGASFDLAVVEDRPAPRAARSYEDCLATAQAHAQGYGLEAGFQACIDAVLPDLPESFELGGRHYSWCIGFSFDDLKRPVLLFDEGEGIEQIPVREVPFDPPLDEVARLWLASYERWALGDPA